MVAYVFDTILQQGVAAGEVPARTRAARDWFRETASSFRTTPNELLRGAAEAEGGSALTGRTFPGRMYTFFYDPKTKRDLPYYDRFPLIFKIKNIDGGFLGINMHYLPPQLRARLMDALYPLATNRNYDETTRLRLTYEILNSATKYRFFKPTIKKYLNSNVRSRYIQINANQWDMALFLPTERFVKKNKNFVWRESRQAIRRR
tara:strand:+ start:1756 stop:2367 length:612 start_codon:yes stop_codon:yes gene_type:complete